MSLNNELATLFSRMAAIMEIKGEAVFKAIAFSKVGRLLKDMTFDIRQAYELGANFYVHKPAGLDAFLRMVQTLMELWLTYGRLPSAE